MARKNPYQSAGATRFPITLIRSCEACGAYWQQTTKRKSLACPDCSTVGQWSNRLVEFTHLSGDLKIDHCERLSQILPNYTGAISRWEPHPFDGAPVWPPVSMWLITTLIQSKSDIELRKKHWLLKPTSDVHFDKIEVWYTSSTAYHYKNETVIACDIRVDGEKVVSWFQPIAMGKEMNNVIGDYCACISALELVSEMVTVLQGFNCELTKPTVTIAGDTVTVHEQIQGSYSVKKDSLRSLYRQACELIDETGASHEYLGENPNLAKRLLPSFKDLGVGR